jgi:CRP-like cAMP-binding protein
MKFFKAGETLIQEGSNDNDLFILFNGSLGIYKGDVMVAKFKERGTIVGEMSTILDRPRTATIKALEDSNVIDLKTDLDELIKSYPAITKDIIRSLANRLMNTTDEFFHLADKVKIDDSLK